MIRTFIIGYAQSQIRVKPYNIHGSKRSFGGCMIHDCIVEQTKCHFKEGNTGEKTICSTLLVINNSYSTNEYISICSV
jgi:hypothetical protein